MCADCTVSICEGCADRKSGASIGDTVTGRDVKMTDATNTDAVAEISTFHIMDQSPTRREIGTETTGTGADGGKGKLDWCGPYHEVFRSAYLEWKAAHKGHDGFVSAEGVEFMPGTGRQGGRKRKAAGGQYH